MLFLALIFDKEENLSMKKTLTLLMSSIAFLSLFWTTPATAQGAKFCFKINNIDYDDSGNDEDIWTGLGDRYLRGVRVSVRKQGASEWAWEGYVNDSNDSAGTGVGCTPVFINPSGGHTGYWQLKVTSRGYINGNYLYSRDRATGGLIDIIINNYIVLSSGTFNVSVNPSGSLPEFKVYLAAAEALHTETAGLSNRVFRFKTGIEQPGDMCDTCYRQSDNVIYVNTETSDESLKFKFIHELGHWISVITTNGKIRGTGCSGANYQNFTDCPSVGTHAMTSKETGRCAAGEGFAHFYSASIWNLTSESDCFFKLWSGVKINCESGDITHPTRYMEKTCNNDWDWNQDGVDEYHTWDGLGVELDWFRVFWNMRTDACSPTASVSTWMSSWLNTIPDFGSNSSSALSAYDKLDTEATKPGQLSSIKNCWNATKEHHGIDHPIGTEP